MRNVSLVMFKSDGTRRDFLLSKDRTIVGRKVNCDLRIPLTSVSRQHCQIKFDGEKITVKDLGSSNGTYHNSVRVQEAALCAGDELVVGPVVFTLVVDGQPSSVKPVRTIISHGTSAREPISQASAQSARGSALGAQLEEDKELEVPELIDEEGGSPTVDLDDPITALEALGESGTADDSDDSDEFDAFDEIDFLDEDDDED